MDRRGYLALVGAGLTAGCSTVEEFVDGSTPTETEAETPEDATESPTETPTDVRTETPTGEERAATALEDGRAAIRTAHETYLGQVTGAETLLDVGPATEGFDDEEIHAVLDEAEGHLSTVAEHGTDEQRQAVDRLRPVVAWFREAAALQGAMSDALAGLEAVDAAAREGEDLEVIVDHLDETLAAIEATGTAESALERPRLNTLHQMDFVEARVVDDKQSALARETVAFSEMGRYAQTVRRETERLLSARSDMERHYWPEAESKATTARRALRDTRRPVSNLNPSSFTPVAEAFTSAVNALAGRAEDLAEDAENRVRY